MTDETEDRPVLLRETIGQIAILTLNRPEKLNSMNLRLQEELHAALVSLSNDDDCKVVILTGSGRAFSGGQDLEERAAALEKGGVDLGASLEKHYHPMIELIRNNDKTVIAALNGVAAGAGANLALACDIVLAARSAKLIQAFARIGLVPDCGGTWMLPRLVGEARARGMAMLGEDVSAETAAEWGLIWKVVPDETLMDEARAIATTLVERSPLAAALTKRALASSWTWSLQEQLHFEHDAQRSAGNTAFYRKSVKAFTEKRKGRKAADRHQVFNE